MGEGDIRRRAFFPQGAAYRGMRIAALGFFIALAGVGLGFFSWAISQRWLAVFAWFVGVAGCCTGFVGVAIQWSRNLMTLIAKIRAWLD